MVWPAMKKMKWRSRNFLNPGFRRQSIRMKGFYENLYLYQSYSWFAFIGQDFLSYYRYTHRWVDLFDKEPAMIHD